MEINPFGNHAKALALRAQRNEVLANNIANADTPGYKARDLDFKAAMANETGGTLRMTTTRAGHIADSATPMDTHSALKWRVPTQPSVDGNTVESDVEQAAYAENVVGYQASLAFINRKISGIQNAIRGGK